MIENDFIGIGANSGSHYLTRRTPSTMSAMLGVIHKGRLQKYIRIDHHLYAFVRIELYPSPSLRTSSARRGGVLPNVDKSGQGVGGRFLLYFLRGRPLWMSACQSGAVPRGPGAAAPSEISAPLCPPPKKKSSR